MKRDDRWEMMYLSYKTLIAKQRLSAKERAQLAALSKQESDEKANRLRKGS